MDIEEDKVIVECNNIGYNIFVPNTYTSMFGKTGTSVKLYTYMSVKEDSISLFGFHSKEELGIFKKMITVSGIGPKGALSILSTLTVDNLRLAIIADDAKAIAKAPGIGAKTASKLILELKDKIDLSTPDSLGSYDATDNFYGSSEPSAKRDAADALIALGYSASEALSTVKKVAVDDSYDAGMIIKLALKELH